jgi:hypothetical protein
VRKTLGGDRGVCVYVCDKAGDFMSHSTDYPHSDSLQQVDPSLDYVSRGGGLNTSVRKIQTVVWRSLKYFMIRNKHNELSVKIKVRCIIIR